ncbi:MAG: Nucleotidyltransferase [Bacteriovoracaceae bacterium]|nr:Nucleotidyltransferase [Bacteriovoracaceae bacterium]
MSSDRERIEHIAEAILQIRKYSNRGREAFKSDELIQNWMVRHLQVIGEAASKLSIEIKTKHTEVPWREIIGMRHVLVHDYFEIDVERVWKVIEHDLDRLNSHINKLLGK